MRKTHERGCRMHFKPVLLGLVALGWTTSVNASFSVLACDARKLPRGICCRNDLLEAKCNRVQPAAASSHPRAHVLQAGS